MPALPPVARPEGVDRRDFGHARGVHVRRLLLAVVACAPARPTDPAAQPAAPGPPSAGAMEHAPEDMPEETSYPSAAAALPAPAAPALPPLQPAPGVRVVLETRAQDVVALPGMIVALDPDFMHLRGLDPATGAEAWRTSVQERPSGMHTLYPLGERVLLHAGPSLAIVDARDGKLLDRRHAGGYNGGDGGCGLRIVRGMADIPWRTHVPWDSESVACGIACDCGLQLFDCATGAPQQRYDSAVTHLYHSLSEPHDNVCWKPPRLLGRVKGRTFAAIEVGDGYELVALAGDRVAWQDARLGAAVGRFTPSGGDEGRDVCWASADDELVVWTCSTGKPRWRARHDPAEGYARERVRLVGDRLLVERRTDRRNVVEARALSTGKRLWQRVLAADRAALIDADLPGAPWWDGGLTYVRIDPVTGATLTELPLAARESLWRDPAGGYVRAGGAAYAELDADGRERRSVARDMSGTTWLDGHFVVLADPTRLTVLRRPSLAVALTAAGQFDVSESNAALAPGSLLLRERRKDEPMRIALLRADP